LPLRSKAKIEFRLIEDFSAETNSAKGGECGCIFPPLRRGEVCPACRTAPAWKTKQWTKTTVIAFYEAVAAFFVPKSKGGKLMSEGKFRSFPQKGEIFAIFVILIKLKQNSNLN